MTNKKTRWYDHGEVVTGDEVKGGPLDGLPAVTIKLTNYTTKKKVRFAIPETVARQLAKEILEATS